MDVANVPIGKSVIVADTDYIKSKFTRKSRGEGRIELTDPSTGNLVMRVRVNMNTGVQIPMWFDPAWWTILVDGKPHHGAGAANGSMEWTPQNRTINITTRK